jgi:ABC-type uncharacterized transport system substrate-binding protein
MRRREFIAGLGGTAAWPLAARAQQLGHLRRIAVVMGGAENDPETQGRLQALRRGLTAAGWNEGKNILLDYHFAEGSAERALSIAAEVVRNRPDVILANSTPVVAALKKVTQTIPIVFAVVNDPVGQGFIESLARPGGNITGFTFIEFELIGKWLSLLRLASPAIRRSAVLFNPVTSPYYSVFLRSFEASQHSFPIAVTAVPIASPSEIDGIVATLARDRDGSLIIPPDAFVIVHRAAILEAAKRHALPTITSYRQLAVEGGLMSYGPDSLDVFERSASYVDRILRGANPADLPAQAPVKFEFYLNLKTAKALGLDIRPNLIALADAAIE